MLRVSLTIVALAIAGCANTGGLSGQSQPDSERTDVANTTPKYIGVVLAEQTPKLDRVISQVGNREDDYFFPILACLEKGECVGVTGSATIQLRRGEIVDFEKQVNLLPSDDGMLLTTAPPGTVYSRSSLCVVVPWRIVYQTKDPQWEDNDMCHDGAGRFLIGGGGDVEEDASGVIAIKGAGVTS